MADYLTFLALSRLREATALAGMAYTTASSASGTANDKIISSSPASGSGSRIGQEWEQHVGGVRVGSWTWDGSAWITSN